MTRLRFATGKTAEQRQQLGTAVSMLATAVSILAIYSPSELLVGVFPMQTEPEVVAAPPS